MTELDLDYIAETCVKTRGGYPVMAAISMLEYVPNLINEIRRLRADLGAVRELAGPDNESGFISTDALLHTIGAGESRLAELQAQAGQVKALHKPITAYPGGIENLVCGECSNLLPNGRFLPVVEYPCPTIKALGGNGE